MAGLILRRSWLIVLLAVAAAMAAWLTTRGQESVYERTLSFVVRPGPGTSSQVYDGYRSQAGENGRLVTTMAGVFGSERFLRLAVDEAGVTDPASYTVSSSVRPGSDIIDVGLRGPDPELLVTLASEYRQVADGWISESYGGAFELDFVDEEAPAGAVAPQTTRSVVLAFLLGGLLALGVVFAEARVREGREPENSRARRPSRVPRPPRSVGPRAGSEQTLASIEDATGRRAEQLEALIEPLLAEDERVVRAGPRRFRIERSSAAKDPASGQV